MELKEQLKESEVTKTSVELQKQGSVVDEVLAGTKEADCLNPLVSNLNKMLEEEDINLFDRMLANYLLGHAYNAIVVKTCSPEDAQYNNPLVWKEVYCYRMALRYVDYILCKEYVVLYNSALHYKYDALIQLGNTYSHMGRFQDGIESYKAAALMMPHDNKWCLAFGYTLFNTHSYYDRNVEGFVVSLTKDLLKSCLKDKMTGPSANAVYNTIKEWKSPSLDKDKLIEYESSEEGEYNRWVNKNILRLNAYNDINSMSALSQEDSLYFDGIYTPKEEPESWKRLFKMLNEIKQEYVSARYMLYYYFTHSGGTHISDKNVRLADIYDQSNYSFHLELAKSSFRSLYSILDKIAFALNDYLCLGVKPERVFFNKIWFEGDKSFKVKRGISKYKSVYGLAGLLFIRNDIFGGDKDYLQAEETKLLNKVRNAMEHRAIIIVDDGVIDDDGAVLVISRSDFEDVSINLIKTVRQAIFCFVNSVNVIEHDKKTSIKEKGGLIMPQEVGCVRDEEKV